MSDMPAPSEFIDSMTEKFLESVKITDTVALKFENMEYMNSSTVQPILKIIKHLEKNKIRTHITYRKALKWQAASFKAFETLLMLMKYITIKGI